MAQRVSSDARQSLKLSHSLCDFGQPHGTSVFLICKLVIMNSLSKYSTSTSALKGTGNRDVNVKGTFLVVTQL